MTERDTKAVITTAERVARNDAIFRYANEKIRRAADEHEMRERVPFICECADPECREIVLLDVDAYERVRVHPTQFFNVPGHQSSAQGWARVTEEHADYVVVEKIGEAASVVKDLDPRQ